MKFLYLIQAAGSLPKIYDELKQKNKLLLSYANEASDTDIFFPNSTWTEGRNKLREYIIEKKMTNYDWYIHIDEDIVFKDANKTFTDLEEQLKSITHDIVTVPRIGHAKTEYKSKQPLMEVAWWDAMLNCFTNKMFLSDDKIFPYIAEYDNKSWWTSHEIVIHICKDWLKLPVLQLNDFAALNLQHKKYPTQGWPVWRQKVLKEVYENIKHKFPKSVRDEWDNKEVTLI